MAALKSPRASPLRKYIRSVPDFPKKGILFRDVTPLLKNGEKFKECIRHFKEMQSGPVDTVISIESRGFIFGAALAYALGAGFVPVRKEGKLPFKKHSKSYALEYGQATIEIHADAIKKGARVVIVDDVLATGGTVQAAIHLVEKLGGNIRGVYFLIELLALGGRRRLGGYPAHSLIQY